MTGRLEDSGWPADVSQDRMPPRSPRAVGDPHQGNGDPGALPGRGRGAGGGGLQGLPQPEEGPGTGALDQPGALPSLGPQQGTEPPPPQVPTVSLAARALRPLSQEGVLAVPHGTPPGSPPMASDRQGAPRTGGGRLLLDQTDVDSASLRPAELPACLSIDPASAPTAVSPRTQTRPLSQASGLSSPESPPGGLRCLLLPFQRVLALPRRE